MMEKLNPCAENPRNPLNTLSSTGKLYKPNLPGSVTLYEFILEQTVVEENKVQTCHDHLKLNYGEQQTIE